MDDSAIKGYCTWARRELRDEVMRRCAIYDVSEEPQAPAGADAVAGRVLTDVEKRQRGELLRAVKADGLDRTVERAAYTWFNRIAAIRFMEVNDRLPSRTRLLSANDGSFRPQALQEPLSVDIEGLDRAEVARLVQEGDDEATFRCLFLAQCHELAECMPGVFERVGAATELLLPDGLLREGGVVERMVSGIPEEDWSEGVEIVGWMYQYYNQERKDEYFASKRKATADDIAPATQLFTPEWIVRYLVENSLGRLWMLNFPDSRLKDSMEYYIDPGEDHEEDFLKVESPEDITFCDPCCGSGHILVYAFDLLARMYEERGYSRREIPRLVLQKNLTGIEIDRRAGQLASFALTMKACEYDRRFLTRAVIPDITTLSTIVFSESDRSTIRVSLGGKHERLAKSLFRRSGVIGSLGVLGEMGSLVRPTCNDIDGLTTIAKSMSTDSDIFTAACLEKIKNAIDMLKPLAKQYSVCALNPPYMSSRNMSQTMSKWLTDGFSDARNDLYACFIKRATDFGLSKGYIALITMQSWAFESTYEDLRKAIIKNDRFTSFLQLGIKTFPNIGNDVVQTCAFSVHLSQRHAKTLFVKLDDFKDFDIKQRQFHNPDNRSFIDSADLLEVPGAPLTAAFADASLIHAWDRGERIENFGKFTGSQNITSDNNRFLRLFWEVSASNIAPDRWVLYAKGGDFRRYYGNLTYVVDWREQARKYYRDTSSANLLDRWYWYREGITYSAVTSRGTGFRYLPTGCVFDKGGATISVEHHLPEILALLNSKISEALFHVMNPSINLQVRDIKSLPIILPEDSGVREDADELIRIAKRDWDELETSIDFSTSPILGVGTPLRDATSSYIEKKRRDSSRALDLMKDIDRSFAEAYSVNLDTLPEYEPRDIPVNMPTETSCIRSLISYAVGCMMGRYSLDVDGLVLADQGATLKDYLAKVPNPTFMPDEDGIIPLTDVEYFHDDATGLFVDFLKAAYGEDTLEENLAFVAESLGGEGSPREVIRNYFRNEFFADHCKTYSVTGSGKRPIYWLFDSGKKGGFRALFYMHRYTPDLLARLRTDYVHPQQERYRNQIEHIDEVLPTADRREAARLKKERKRLSDQLAETNAYEEKVHHLADQMIRIDLDDGVKHNYALFQDVLAKIK